MEAAADCRIRVGGGDGERERDEAVWRWELEEEGGGTAWRRRSIFRDQEWRSKCRVDTSVAYIQCLTVRYKATWSGQLALAVPCLAPLETSQKVTWVEQWLPDLEKLVTQVPMPCIRTFLQP